MLTFGLVALKKLASRKHVQQDQASGMLQACGACLLAAHKALFCPRCTGQPPQSAKAQQAANHYIGDILN